jgi:hypothetical protein
VRRAVAHVNGLKKILAAGLISSAVVLAVSGCGGGSVKEAHQSSTPTNMQAANGPLVGETSLIPDEQTCEKDHPNEPWFASIAAFEVYDSARTHLYACAHFLGSQTTSNKVLAYQSPDVYETPYNIVTKGPSSLYIYGGGYGDNPSASGSFVASVEPGTLKQRWRTVLINTKATGEWDYPGVLNVMKNGDLVVIYGYHIARLNPANGTVEASATLPTGESAPGDTAYNGFDALPDGTIIAKTVNREKGCKEEGFSAFLKCPNPTHTPPSVMVAVDPSSLKVLGQITLPEMMGGRVTTASFHGRNYIYLPGTKSLFRYTFENGRFAQDHSWGPVPYLKEGQSAGSAMAAMGEYVVAMTNGGTPTSTPMSVVAVSQADAKKVLNLQPFASSGAKNSFIPSMVSVDPLNHQIYVMDAGAGKVGDVALKEGKLSLVWSQDQTTLSFTTLVGPQDKRVLIGTNIPVKYFKQLKSYSTEQVIWREAATGKELASSEQFPKMSAGILVTPSYAGLQYFLTAEGHIIALQVKPG